MSETILFTREQAGTKTELTVVEKPGNVIEFWVNGCLVWRGNELYQGPKDRLYP